MHLIDMMSTEANQIAVERRAESLLDRFLTEGELAEELSATDARDLLGIVIRELFSPKRDFDRTPADHVQSCCVFARDAIRRRADALVAELAGE